MIEIRDVEKRYAMGDTVVHALRGVTLRIDDGDFVAIMGPSGSGKSTLAHILGLLDVPTAGSYVLNGKEASGLSEDELALLRREEIGFIFQQFNLLPRMDAEENVALPLLYSRGGAASKDPLPRELLERVGLGPRIHHRPNELSGGQQQRVAIARALVNHPRVVIADEPTGNLDSVSEKEILGKLRELNEQGITVIIVTHEDEIGAQANRLIRMRDGVVQSDERLRGALNPSRATAPRASVTSTTPGTIGLIEHFRQGFRTLLANKVRTALSVLGILIGVAAVIALLALGSGAQKAITDQLSALGSNMLVLRAGSVRTAGVAQQSGAVSRLEAIDATLIRERISAVKDASASVNGRVQVAYLNRNWNTSLTGTQPVYSRMKSLIPVEGRFFTEEEGIRRALVAVIGPTVAQELFAGKSPIGETIRINRIAFQVIGLLPEKGGSGFTNQDDLVLIPLQTAMRRVLGKDYVDTIDIEVKTPERMAEAEDAIQALMIDQHRVPEARREGAFEIWNMADIQNAVAASTQTMTALLAAIAAISLLVGGIGIMNIMLVSVTERTKEIGLRKAIGARRKDILLQFLAESVVVSLVGGVAGVALGWLITFGLSFFTGWSAMISLGSVLLAFFFSAFIGVVFGIYPARQGSRLHPIDALRHD